jgi:hypothetical protein
VHQAPADRHRPREVPQGLGKGTGGAGHRVSGQPPAPTPASERLAALERAAELGGGEPACVGSTTPAS